MRMHSSIYFDNDEMDLNGRHYIRNNVKFQMDILYSQQTVIYQYHPMQLKHATLSILLDSIIDGENAGC